MALYRGGGTLYGFDCTLLMSINEIFPYFLHFRWIWIKMSTEEAPKSSQIRVVEIGLVRNFCPKFPPLLKDLGEIRMRSGYNAIQF